MDESGKVLSETATDANGNYHLASPKNVRVQVVILCEVRYSGAKSYSVKVVDPTKGVIRNRPAYSFGSGYFNVAAADAVMDINTAYRDTRLGDSSDITDGLPFSLLDSASQVLRKVVDAGGSDNLPLLTIHWSASIVDAAVEGKLCGAEACYRTGFSSIGVGYYLRSSTRKVFPYFDSTTLAHEIGHFLEDVLGFDRFPEGSHSKGNLFAGYMEAFADAFSLIVTDNDQYNAYASILDSTSGMLKVSGGYGSPDSRQGVFNEYNTATAMRKAFGGDLVLLFRALRTSQFLAQDAGESVYKMQWGLSLLDPIKGAEMLSAMKSLNIKGEGPYGEGETFIGQTVIPNVLPFYQTLSENSATRACTSKSGPTTNQDMANLRAFTVDVSVPGFYDFAAKRVSSDFGITHPGFIFLRKPPYTQTWMSINNGDMNDGIMKNIYLGAGKYTVYFMGDNTPENLATSGMQVSCYDVTVTRFDAVH